MDVAKGLKSDNVLESLHQSCEAQGPLRYAVFPTDWNVPDDPDDLALSFCLLEFIMKPLQLEARIVEFFC